MYTFRQQPVTAVLFFLLFLNCGPESGIIAVSGGTIVDTGEWGGSAQDIENAVLLIEDGKITAAGTENEIDIPGGARIIDASGKYIVPGLIDGFAAINNQAYANAYLYCGVTSIVGVSGGRRGPLYTEACPGPEIFRLEGIGDIALPTDSLLAIVDDYGDMDVRVLLIMYQTRESQLAPLIERARGYGMVTIGELGHASYADGIREGIDAFVHTTRYSLNAAPEAMQRAVADNPFSDDLDSPKWRYYSWLTNMDVTDSRFQDHAETLTSGSAALMPTLSLLYLDQQWNDNPWERPAAALLDSADIDAPADRSTGEHTYDPAHMEAYAALAAQTMRIERVYAEKGAKYLAGSATDVWGTMPGISLHTELEGLTRIGLTNRQALAAATGNFAEQFGWKIGRIAPGYEADILILDKNPLEDIENLNQISNLIVNGTEIGRNSLLKRQ